MKKFSNIFIAGVSLFALTGCNFLKGIDDLSNLGEESGTESLPYSVAQTRQKLETISKNNGLEIKFKIESKEDGESVTTSTQMTFGMKENTYWAINQEEDDDFDGSAYVINEEKDKAYVYEYVDEEWSYLTTRDISSDDLSEFESFLNIDGYLYYGHAYDGILKKDGTTTIAGRKCDNYKYSINYLTFKTEYICAVDQETGATLKLTISASSGGESAYGCFEVTSFKTSGITLPDLPEPCDSTDDDDDDDNPGVDDNDNDNNSSTTSNKYNKELMVNSKSELRSKTNELIIAKYVGTQEQLTDSDLYISDYGTLDIYFAWSGFYEDGSRNNVSGYTCLYYFFNDAESYRTGLSLVSSFNLRGTNPDHYYFTVSTTDTDCETYEEFVTNFTTGGDYRHPNFQIVQ